jgi:Ca2+-transporting ATPase
VRSESWHTQSVGDVLDHLETDIQGLTDDEAARRLERFGPNQLTPPKPVSAVKILVDQLRSVVVVLLVAALAVSLLLGDRLDAVAIAAVVLINTVIGFVTEIRARRAMEALLQFDVPRASVVRSGHLSVIPAHTLVPGDVIRLMSGQHVPADGRVIESTDLPDDRGGADW